MCPGPRLPEFGVSAEWHHCLAQHVDHAPSVCTRVLDGGSVPGLPPHLTPIILWNPDQALRPPS